MLALIILGALNFASPNIEQPTFWHIGYKNGRPVFLKSTSEKKLELFQMDDSLHLKKLDNALTHRPIFFNDCSFVSISPNEGKNKVLFYKGGRITAIETPSEVHSLTLSSDCRFLASSGYDSVYLFKDGILIFRTEGAFPVITGNYVYYNSYDGEVDAMVSLYRSCLTTPKAHELILTNIYESGIHVFDGGNYIACNVNKDGRPQKAIYNANTKKFNLIDIPNSEDFPYPVYLPLKKSIIYYNPSGLRISKEIQVK